MTKHLGPPDAYAIVLADLNIQRERLTGLIHEIEAEQKRANEEAFRRSANEANRNMSVREEGK